ncbi:MAG: TonB family protein [Deltaproteobacteria bacterium]|nr:TonB family protein [Deltaproteobacteria bacterium]
MSNVVRLGHFSGPVKFQASDRYSQASKIGNLLGFLMALGLLAWFITHPEIFSPGEPLAPPQDLAITVELWADQPALEAEASPPLFEEIPEMEPLPEMAPIADLDPALEPERVADPVPVKKPPPPKPKANPKVPTAQRTPAPLATEAAAPAAVAAPKANPNESKKFISEFLKLVEKNKFYPHQARRDNLTGTVKVRVSFNGQGQISGLALVAGDYPEVLAQAALSTMEKVKSRWPAKPGAPNSLVVPIAFRLR